MKLELVKKEGVGQRGDIAGFERALAGAGEDPEADLSRYLIPNQRLTVARAPARLDCMGGIADYSGSVVCEMPLRESVVVGLQKRDDRWITIHSHGIEKDGFNPDFRMSLEDLYAGELVRDYGVVAELLRDDPSTRWAAYVAGAFHVLLKEGYVESFPSGANIVISSEIPMGVGIGSSGALEVATLHAVNVAYSLGLQGAEIAALGQRVENRVVGAPCGIMDQVTSTLGSAGRTIAIRCQPDTILGNFDLPPGLFILGVNSSVKHSVAGDRYTDVRVGTFMGLKIILSHAMGCQSGGEEMPFGGYLANVPKEDFNSLYRPLLPRCISGGEFLDRYGPTTDPVTRVNPEKSYMVRSRTEHPVYENARAERFLKCLELGADSPKSAEEAGGLMYASDWSYQKRCGLGSPETSLLVALIRAEGPTSGFYGAKITGGGSGGTVAVAGDERMFKSLPRVLAQYHEATGMEPDVLCGSSPGAVEFGYLEYHFSG